MKLSRVFLDGAFKNNPVFIQLIGLCSTLAITNSLTNSLAMGIAVTFVLIMSNTVVSALRKIIPDKIRIPCFIVVIATFVTLVQMILQEKDKSPRIEQIHSYLQVLSKLKL